MILSFHPCFVADAQVIPGGRKLDSRDLSLIAGAKAVILPQSCSLDLYRACRSSSALLFPNYDFRFKYRGKTGQSRFFENMACPFPLTRRWRSTKVLMRARIREWPLFIKADNSHEGTGVWLIRDRGELESALARLEDWGGPPFITQQVILCDGNVLRVVVLGKRFVSYWKRPAEKGAMVTTVSRGARVDKRWRRDLQAKGVAAAGRVCKASGINLAAMDFLFPMTEVDPEPLILEINYYFGRRGLGGSLKYYRLLHRAIREWLEGHEIDPNPVKLI